MGCCGPSTCFTCHESPQQHDACMCGCGYFNGLWPILTAQFFTLVGAVLSLATLGDCAFATLDRTLILDWEEAAAGGGGTGTTTTEDIRGVGFITFERRDGQCYWYGEGSSLVDPITQLERYWTVLGSQWQIGMGLTWFCAIFSWYFFLYTISYCCSSQVKCCRYLNGFCLSVVLVIAQGCTFLAYGSEFCYDYQCAFGRTAGYSVGAIVCYLISGIAFFFSKDYPGTQYTTNKDGRAIEEVTNAGVDYHPDPELTSVEYKEAKRISQQLGGGGGEDNENYTTIPSRSITEGHDDTPNQTLDPAIVAVAPNKEEDEEDATDAPTVPLPRTSREDLVADQQPMNDTTTDGDNNPLTVAAQY